MNRNLEQFFLRPHEDIVATECLFVDTHNSYTPSCRPVFDWEKVKTRLQPNLDAYFSQLVGPISTEESERIIWLAKENVGARKQSNTRNNPTTFINSVRANMLLHHPAFLADKCAVSFVKTYAPVSPPVGFQMWVEYQSKDDWANDGFRRAGYYLKSVFDLQHIPTLHNMILCDELWTGDAEIQRVFFSSIGEMLWHLSREKNLLLQTIEPRMEIMRRVKRFNTETHSPHETWCAAAFRREEIATLELIAKHYDPKMDEVLKATKVEAMRQYPHSC